MKGKEQAVSKQSEPSVAPKKAKKDVFADFDFENLEVDINAMFKAGVYFGHQKSRKNPKMNEYIYTTRNGINIIDLQKTAEKIKEAQSFIKKLVASGQEIVFVGTKKQAKDIVRAAAEICQEPFVIERWLGGTFTNLPAILKRTRFLKEGQENMEKGEMGKYTKFEQMKMREELEKLENKMGGIKNMTKLPGAVFITGVNEDNLAVKEARKMNIPVIGLVDTNVNPEDIDYPIPANEDAVSSLKLLVAYITKAVLEGKKSVPKEVQK